MSVEPMLSQSVDIPVPQDYTYFQRPEDYERLGLRLNISEVISGLHKTNALVTQYWYGNVDFPEAVRELLLKNDGERFKTIQKSLFKEYQLEEQLKRAERDEELRDQEYVRSFRYETMGHIAACLGCNATICGKIGRCVFVLLFGLSVTMAVLSYRSHN